MFCVGILIFQQEYLLRQRNGEKKALEKIGGNPKLAKQQGSKPWFLSQSAQLPKKALHFFSVMSTRPQCQYLSQVPSVHSALQLMQNKDFILLAA